MFVYREREENRRWEKVQTDNQVFCTLLHILFSSYFSFYWVVVSICITYLFPSFFPPILILYSRQSHMYRVFRKNCGFFYNSLQPLPRLHRCKRPSKLSTQSECTVAPIGWSFSLQPIGTERWRRRGGKLSKILEKNTIFDELPVFISHEYYTTRKF